MWWGYASYAGTELWNNVRTLDYLYGDPDLGVAGLAPAWTSVDREATCRSAIPLFCDQPRSGSYYRSPAYDNAPWYDADVPESANFAGLYVEEMEGFDSVIRREMTDLATIGGSVGPLRFSGRQVTVTGWLRAKDCCAAEYGLRWLMEALLGDVNCSGCTLDDLYMIRCCPPASDIAPDPVNYARLMQRVALLDGPKVVDRAGSCCENCTATSLKVQFTLASETPYLFSDFDWVTYQEPFDTQTEVLRSWDSWCPDCPQVAEDVFPTCGPTLTGPPAPFLIDDADCYCDPWYSNRKCVSFSNGQDWNDVSTYIEVQAGSTEVRNLRVAAYNNPLAKQGYPCPCEPEADDFWKCQEPCSQFVVGQMPSGSTLIVDSRSRRIDLVLAGGTVVPGLRYISSGSRSTPFDWFDLGPCTDVCFVAWVDHLSTGASISIGAANRYLASGG